MFAPLISSHIDKPFLKLDLAFAEPFHAIVQELLGHFALEKVENTFLWLLGLDLELRQEMMIECQSLADLTIL